MTEEKIERLYTVTLGKAYEYTRTKRTRRTVSILRQFLIRHMKSVDIKISEQLNEFLWARSMQKPPRRVKIKVVKEGGVVRASLPDEKPKPARRKKVATEAKKETPKAEKAPVKETKTGETKK